MLGSQNTQTYTVVLLFRCLCRWDYRRVVTVYFIGIKSEFAVLLAILFCSLHQRKNRERDLRKRLESEVQKFLFEIAWSFQHLESLDLCAGL